MDLDAAMRRALAIGREGVESGQAPFGAVVLCQGREIAAAHNSVRRDTDPTAHAEVNALRVAARAMGTTDLGGCILVSTCEPCPMCLAAAVWAGIEAVVFGASIGDAEAAGFSQIRLAATTVAHAAPRPIRVEGGRLRDACLALFEEWKHRR
ncbi:MAG: tRNA-specific adenosine deaminase [Isosphaeraceae bacterium]|jgi:tRNA(Arg) A34 adenosine deaminase TadA|nr:MAG: tRNA-specific adenosine deaminase [Isosphaeraceae bacterium]